MQRHLLLLLAAALLALPACQSDTGGKNGEGTNTTEEPVKAAKAEEPESAPASAPKKEGFPTADMSPEGKGIATFAGGCFWCMEPPFEAIDGVEAVYSGYTGGKEERPTYKEVAYGKTTHAESIRVVYDKDKVDYELLAKVFWRNVDPTQKDGQFVDKGRHYRTAIYYHDEAQKKVAEATKAETAKKFDEPIVTEITEAGPFYPAETYHQDFYLKDKSHYQRYRSGSGRDDFLRKAWGEEAGGYKLHGGEKKH